MELEDPPGQGEPQTEAPYQFVWEVHFFLSPRITTSLTRDAGVLRGRHTENGEFICPLCTFWDPNRFWECSEASLFIWASFLGKGWFVSSDRPGDGQKKT